MGQRVRLRERRWARTDWLIPEPGWFLGRQPGEAKEPAAHHEGQVAAPQRSRLLGPKMGGLRSVLALLPAET